MRKLALAALLAAVTLLGVSTPRRCDAVWCPDVICYGPCGGPGCICLSEPGKAYGRCYGTNYAEGLIGNGYKEVGQ